jgi:hypothetical protein
VIRHSPAERATNPPLATNAALPFSLPDGGFPARFALLLTGLSAVLLGAGCGVQGPVRPPRVERPEAVAKLVLGQTGRSLLLSFTLPSLATDGERLTKPLELEIFRAVTLPGQPAPATAQALALWSTLTAEDLACDAESGHTVVPLTLSQAEFQKDQGATFTFALRPLTRGFRHRAIVSDFSPLVRTTLLDAPGPVKDLRARATERAIELTWSAPAESVSGRSIANLSAYRVYRSRTGKPGSFQLLGEIVAPAYQDSDFEFKQTYFYEVRATVAQGGSTAESEATPPAEITPLDTFPPAAPSSLSAVYTTRAVELVWTANTEPDLAGYNVYRREGNGNYQKLNPQLLPTPIYRDASVETGRQYFYRVTAADLSNNESAPSEGVSVETR